MVSLWLYANGEKRENHLEEQNLNDATDAYEQSLLAIGKVNL